MSGIIPRSFIDELLSRVDIVEFIDSYVSLKKQGTSYVACCPFHTEKTPSFNVISKKQFYHCFGCGVSGNAISFGMNYLHLPFPEVIETLAARVGMQVPREKESQPYQQSKNLYQLLAQVSGFYQQQLNQQSGKPALDYLQARGINKEIALRFQLGYSPAGWHTLEGEFKTQIESLITSGMLIQRDDGKIYDRYRHRIMYPIHDKHGRLIGFGGRAIDVGQKPKYLNSPETSIFQKGRELYGLHQVLTSQNTISNIIIVEGYMDVIALAQHGINFAVATLGTATSAYHIQSLSKHTPRLTFCFDGDTAGKQAAWRALESCLPHLNAGLDACFIFLPEGHDPDSLVREEGATSFLQRLNQATPLHQFFFNTLTQPIDINTLVGKSQLVNKCKPYLQKMTEGPYFQLILNELSRLTRLDTEKLSQLIASSTQEEEVIKQQTIQRTPARVAIALLLQHPHLYHDNFEMIRHLEFKAANQAILNKVMKEIAQNPSITTGILLETFRNSVEFEALNKLAAWDHQVPDEALSREYIDTLVFLAKQEHDKKIEQLITKSRQQGLLEEERLLLQNMLKQRHTTIVNIREKE